MYTRAAGSRPFAAPSIRTELEHPRGRGKQPKTRAALGSAVLYSSKEKEEFCETRDKATQSTDLGICGGFRWTQIQDGGLFMFTV